jgi:hypothetical protein
VRFQRSLAHGLERGPSDFDIRNNFQAALSYDIPGHYSNEWLSYALKHWSLDTRISARSALPVDIFSRTTIDSASGQGQHFHPDRVLSQPLYAFGSAPTENCRSLSKGNLERFIRVMAVP